MKNELKIQVEHDSLNLNQGGQPEYLVGELFSLVGRISEAEQILRNKEPYQINLLDMMNIKETLHTKILKTILSKKEQGTYKALQSFFDYLRECNPSFMMTVKDPQITTEFMRIDLLVRDKDYAIILENKIKDAVDQPKQLHRYIKQVKSLGYADEQIFVLYLTRDENKNPSDDSWGAYKESYQDRFLKITCRDHVYTWLKNQLLPLIDPKDDQFSNAVKMYIDHIEGIFGFRKYNVAMNKETKDILSKELNFTDSIAKNYTLLSTKIDDLGWLLEHLNEYKKVVREKVLKDWTEKIKSDFGTYKVFDNIDHPLNPNLGITINNESISFSILLEWDSRTNKIYYGIGKHFASESLMPILFEKFSPILEKLQKSEPWWYGRHYTSCEVAYEEYKLFVEEVLDFIKG